MATNITVKVIGGHLTQLDGNFETVADVKAELGRDSFTAQVNGADASDDASLSDGDFITLAQPVKGG